MRERERGNIKPIRLFPFSASLIFGQMSSFKIMKARNLPVKGTGHSTGSISKYLCLFRDQTFNNFSALKCLDLC